ncbi:hCG1815013, isoform CRA_b [Homo sapiens]|nr:hCG1815013, isoform CRA_b [Homo sapiens]|eukprot:NP_001229733.1 uncharacterized protein LOC100505549 [Homo sapiens]
MEFHSCCPSWCTMARSRLTSTSASQCVRNWWVLGLTDFKNEAAHPHGIQFYCQAIKLARKPKLLFSTLYCSTLCPPNVKALEGQRDKRDGPFRTGTHVWLER